jgi:hypothetical protein
VIKTYPEAPEAVLVQIFPLLFVGLMGVTSKLREAAARLMVSATKAIKTLP